MPIVRPLFLHWPKQPAAWNDWQTFLYGPDVLISAIWEKGATRQSLYLPEGEHWVDVWNPDKIYDGGRYITVKTPLHKIPIFVRKDSGLIFADLNKLYEESIEIASKKPDLAQLQKEAFESEQ